MVPSSSLNEIKKGTTTYIYMNNKTVPAKNILIHGNIKYINAKIINSKYYSENNTFFIDFFREIE